MSMNAYLEYYSISLKSILHKYSRDTKCMLWQSDKHESYLFLLYLTTRIIISADLSISGSTKSCAMTDQSGSLRHHSKLILLCID